MPSRASSGAAELQARPNRKKAQGGRQSGAQRAATEEHTHKSHNAIASDGKRNRQPHQHNVSEVFSYAAGGNAGCGITRLADLLNK